jgi:hypothetical protein
VVVEGLTGQSAPAVALGELSLLIRQGPRPCLDLLAFDLMTQFHIGQSGQGML